MEKKQYDPTTQLRWKVFLMKIANKRKSSSLGFCPFSGFWDTGDSLTLILFKGICIFLAPLPSSLCTCPLKWKKSKGVKRWRGKGNAYKYHKGLFSSRWKKVPCPISEFFTGALTKSLTKCQGQGGIADASWFLKITHTHIFAHFYYCF